MKKSGFQEKIRNMGQGLCRVIFFTVASLIIWGCGPTDTTQNAGLHADPKGKFYSTVVDKRFDTGQKPEIDRGQELYHYFCAVCHGEKGDGQGLNAYNLKSQFGVEPTNFTDPALAAKLSYAEIATAISKGGPAVKKSKYMHPWGETFSAYDLACLSDYVWHWLMKKK